MRRQKRSTHYDEDDYHPLMNGGSTKDFVQMERVQRERIDNTIEAKVEVGDTLQALALRFHCTVADIKRLNKIDKDNEIHARKVVKIPVTVHSVLLGTIPVPVEVHKSGKNSPRSSETNGDDATLNIIRNPLEDANAILNEKLIVASVNAAGADAMNSDPAGSKNINTIILNSKLARSVYTDEVPAGDNLDAKAPLITDILDDEHLTHIRPIRGPQLRAIDWSGSDCDMSWVCLFVVILAICIVIPLICVIYRVENAHHHNGTIH